VLIAPLQNSGDTEQPYDGAEGRHGWQPLDQGQADGRTCQTARDRSDPYQDAAYAQRVPRAQRHWGQVMLRSLWPHARGSSGRLLCTCAACLRCYLVRCSAATLPLFHAHPSTPLQRLCATSVAE
jgi:hypothetical protein